MGEHAKLSPSSAHRWMACPGSVKLSESYPDESSEAARHGTFAHEVAARCLTTGAEAADAVGSKSDDGEFVFSDEDAEAVQTYLDAVRAEARGAQRSVKLWVEKRVRLQGALSRVWGTADAVVKAPGAIVHVMDYKHGAGVHVEAEDNPQLMIYSLAALHTLADDLGKPKRVVAHIVQPRHHLGGHARCEFTPAQLKRWSKKELEPAVEAAANDDGTTLSAGEHCRFCPAKSGCPELKSRALEQAQGLFQDLESMAPAKTPPDPSSLSPTDVAVAMKAFPLIEQWMKGVREKAYSLANNGTDVPGYKLVEKAGNRRWKSETEAEELLALIAPTGKDIRTEPKLKSPAQIEKLFGKKGPSLVESLTEKPKTGTTLVPASDPRPALDRGEVFKAIETEEPKRPKS